MTIHVMMDLETWGTEPGCDIRSIGAVVFDPDGGNIWEAGAFYQAVIGGDCLGLETNPQTVDWWNKQSVEARSAFADPINITDGLRDFTKWYSVLGPSENVTLWCNGPHFDEVILKAAYRACGLVHPWHYRAPRDFRTELEGAGWPDVPFIGTSHNALDDAIHQARCIIAARKIRPAVR